MEVIRPGSLIRLNIGTGDNVIVDVSVNARVLAFKVAGHENKLTYECSYWKDGIRYVAWIDPVEIESDDKNRTKIKIGYNNGT